MYMYHGSSYSQLNGQNISTQEDAKFGLHISAVRENQSSVPKRNATTLVQMRKGDICSKNALKDCRRLRKILQEILRNSKTKTM